ncbi:MAG: resolvase [Chloroflexi bacterium HGW-Chloroflexi-5]|jgi:DNA invertase Pin-like site-specific DNA recombinase|nr:MAG: resolvase [Chloroflexi bacterium HGW-Chloroflexi-5]
MAKKAKNVCYSRVSTEQQDTTKFQGDVLQFCNSKGFVPVHFEEEHVSGLKSWRERKLFNIVTEDLQAGDRLVTPELTRLGRSTLEVLDCLKVCRERGIAVYSVKEGLELNGSMQSKVMSTFLALFAELERDFISLRTREALKAKKEQGVKLGRPKGAGKSKLDQYREEIIALLKNGSSKTFVARRYGSSVQNLYNFLHQNKIAVQPVLPPSAT